MVTQQDSPYNWGMVVDVDRCTGCQACVLACQVENNVPLNTENLYKQQRIYAWIRVERYWEGEFPDVKPTSPAEDPPAVDAAPMSIIEEREAAPAGD